MDAVHRDIVHSIAHSWSCEVQPCEPSAAVHLEVLHRACDETRFRVHIRTWYGPMPWSWTEDRTSVVGLGAICAEPEHATGDEQADDEEATGPVTHSA